MKQIKIKKADDKFLIIESKTDKNSGKKGRVKEWICNEGAIENKIKKLKNEISVLEDIQSKIKNKQFDGDASQKEKFVANIKENVIKERMKRFQ